MNAKKWCSLILTMVLLYAGMPMGRAAITNLINTPQPNTAGTRASQRIRFINAVSIPMGGRIEITFPAQYDLSSSGDWENTDITLNLQGGSAVSDIILIGQKISIGIKDADSGTGFQEITLSSNRIINPATPGTYRISLTTLDTDMRSLEGSAQSANFDIVQQMTSASVTLEPNIAGANTKMTIQFRLGTGTARSLVAGDRIRLEFDVNLEATQLNYTTVPGTIPRSCIKVNNTNITTDPKITPGIPGTGGSRGVVDIIVPQNISSTASQGASVTIVFEACAGILNPSNEPWNRRLQVTTLRSDGITEVEGPVFSNFYNVRTTISAPKVFVRPEVVGLNAEYHLSMRLGDGSSLLKNSGRIDVYFPDGTHVPSSIPASAIEISVSATDPTLPCGGGQNPPFEPMVSGQKVSFVMPEDATAGQYICIVFKHAAGLRNPMNPGVYSLRTSTSSDPSIISSQSYSIRLSGKAQVIPIPNKSSEEAKYTITFQTGVDGALYPYEAHTVSLTFPTGFTMPATIGSGMITVNDKVTTVPAVVAGQQITFEVPDVIENNSMVTVVIKKEAGVRNRNVTESPEYHSLVIETSKEFGNNRIISDEFMIYSPIRDVYVTPADLGVGQVTQYEVRFNIGDVNEGLKANDRITIDFPQGTTLPSFISSGNIRLHTLGNDGLTPSSVVITGQRMQLTLPAGFVQLAPLGLVRVVILESAGLRNPDTPGSYRATVFTSRETTPVNSELFTIGTVAGQVQVTVEPNISVFCAGVSYAIQFITGQTGGISPGQRIMVVFSPQYAPIMPTNIMAGTILVNGIPTNANAPVDDASSQHPAGSKVVSIATPVNIPAQSNVKIDFLTSAGIDNPPVSISPQPFYLRIYTDSEPSVISGLYYLVSTVRGITVDKTAKQCYKPIDITLSNYSAGMGTDLTLKLQAGPIGRLQSGTDRIRIKFPQAAHVPSFISGQYIRINTIDDFPGSVSVLNPSITDKMVSFEVPYNINGNNFIDNNENIFIYFQQGGGLVNPTTPGNYQLFASTTKEPTEVPSVHYTIEGVSVSRPTVEPLPTLANAEKAQYTIRFMTGTYGALNIGDTITIDFPAGTVIDPSPPRDPAAPRSISAQHVRINGVPCIMAPAVISDTQVMIYSPVVIPSNSRATIIFTRDARIKNPGEGDNYSVKMWTMREGNVNNPITSEPYEITAADKITKPVVFLHPCTPFSPARYTLEFYTPTQLDANVGKYRIEFPSGTFIPSSMDASKILVSTEDNHNIACQVNPEIFTYSVTITTPVDIAANTYVKIDFLRDAGLQNPDAGNYELRINSVGVTDTTESYAYYVCPELNFGRLEITPSSMRIPVGKAQIFVARAYDTEGRMMDYGVTYRWSLSSNIGMLENTRSQTTEFYARHMGSANLSVIAEYGNRSISTSINVVVTGSMARIQLTPSGITTSRDQRTRFSVQAFDANDEMIEDVKFEWSVSPPLGDITQLPLSNDIEFLAITEGHCVIRVRASQAGIIKDAEAQVTIKVGVNNLIMLPGRVDDHPQPGEVLGPFTIQLQDPQGQPIKTMMNTHVHLSSSSTHVRFSLDGVEWTTSNQKALTVVANFAETMPFYISILEPGDCTIVASSDEYNSYVMPLSVRGQRKRLVFLSAPQNLRRNIPSERISVQVQDIFGQPFAMNRDMLFELKTSSLDGHFSKNTEPWTSVQQFMLPSFQHTLDFHYKDTREGSSTITVSNPLYGSASQVLHIASPGSVSAPEVIVRPAVLGVSATYHISFNVGFDGALTANRDHIDIVFPDGTILPPSIPATMIKVNEISLNQSPAINTQQRSIRLLVPTDISSSGKVDVLIPSITNPDRTGQFILRVATSAQTSFSDSQPYMIDYSTITDLRCVANPSIAGAVAEVLVTFKTGLRGAMEPEQEITILFDYAFQVPSTISAHHVLFNGAPLALDPVVTGKAVIIKIPRNVAAESEVRLMFTKDSGIRNPLYPGLYEIQAYTQAEQALAKSAPFEIVQHSLIRNLRIKATPAMILQNAEYTITFETGPYGALTSEDTITLALPDLVMPMNLPSNALSVNNIRIQQALQVQDHTINIRVPSFIPANEQVTIVIFRQAGIANPPRPANDYRIMAHTSKEPHPVTSEPFAIESELIINYILNPTQPDGANQWYITEPLLIFTSNVPSRIYYRINHGPEREYTEPVRLAEHGQNMIYYRGVSMLENRSEEKSFTYKYDGTPPIIETNIDEEIVYTRENRLAFSILIKDISTVAVTLNDRPVNLINNSYSTILELNEGENRFAIRAMDEAGNVARVERLVIFKAKPPMLLVTSPASFQVLRDVYFATTPSGSELFANVRVRGSTEIGIEEIEVISDTVVGFSTKIPVDAWGNFDRTIGIRSLAGSNVLLFKARDRVGNETQVIVAFMLQITLRLRIGVETGYVNGNPVQLGAKPYLKYGRHTMMPFRLIAESFGATVGWEQATRKVTYAFRGTHIALWIGRNTAEVTDASGRTRIVTLLAEPEIIASRTWVPLRFVSEALGAQVDWDPKLWEAIVHFPPLS